MAATYDSIGVGYAQVRQPDPRIAKQIAASLGSARRVLNVGAGAGSYEPADRVVVALEPSHRMIEQRPPETSRLVIRGMAGELPFPDRSFDAAMALLTLHHWPDPVAGLREMRRVTTGPIVVFTFDYAVHSAQWLVTEYLPSMLELDTDVPSPSAIADALGGGEVITLPVPHDCTDGFCHAWWRRPDAYLDPSVRAGISGDRPSARGRRRARHGTAGRRPELGCMAGRARRPARPHRDRRRLSTRGGEPRIVTRRNVPPPP